MAQDDVEVTANTRAKVINKDSIRAHYVQRYPNHFFVWPVLKQRSLNFEVASLRTKRRRLNFKPNNSYSFGVGVYMFDVGFELAMAIPINEKNIDLYGETKARDLQLNVLARTYGFDLYVQKYKGFYITDPKVNIPKHKPYPQRSDIATRNFGLSGLYILNDKKFSLKSAYNFAERQLESKGSFIMVGTLNAFRLIADSSIFTEDQRVIFGESSSFKELKYTTFSLSPGYTYSIVYKNFFLNGALVIGPAHSWVYYKRNDGSDKNETSVNAFSSIRIGLGYNSDHFFAGINFVTQGRNVKFEEVQFTNSSASLRLLFGYRFHEFGVFKRSVWDLPKEFLKL